MSVNVANETLRLVLCFDGDMTAPQTWLITGASRGLGLALTNAALAAGHRVVATTRGGEPPLRHERLVIHALDVRDGEACRRVVERVVDDTGRLDVLVNNAGYGLVGAIEETTDAEAEAILATDLLGPLRLARAVLPTMRAQGSGHIVQVSSTGGVGAMPFLGLYNAAKWGLEGFSEALAGEARPFGIRVTIAEIGAMDTEWGTGSMQFSDPIAAYDDVREAVLGTPTVPWSSEPGSTGGGSDPAEIAERLMRHIADPGDDRLRVLLGDDAPAQVAAVLRRRRIEYEGDERFVAAASED